MSSQVGQGAVCVAIIGKSKLLRFCCCDKLQQSRIRLDDDNDIGDDDDDKDGFDVCLCVFIVATLQRGLDQICHAVSRVARLPGSFCSG